MVDYSRAAIAIILEDLKKWSKCFKIGFSIFTLVYFIYSFVMEKGNLYVNIVLITLYAIYTIFEPATYKKDMKKVKKIFSRSYKWSKLLIKAFTLGSMLYGIYVASSKVDGISIILATLMIIIWVLQVLLEILIVVIEPKVKLVIAGVLSDVKPVVTAINIFKKDDIVLPLNEYEKEIAILNKKITQMRPVKPKKKLALPNPMSIFKKK